MLLLYEDYFRPDAATIHEHLQAFGRHSRFKVYPLNVALGFPRALNAYTFSACVFHYSLRPTFHWLGEDLARYLRTSPTTYKVALFQDEIWHFQERLAFLRDFQIDCLYSRHKPGHVRDVYPHTLPVKRFVHYLAGHVSADLVAAARRRNRPAAQRPIDVGYRGRRLPFYLGQGSQEKALIGERFRELTQHLGLVVNIETDEGSRLYLNAWHTFLADCKAVLGVEGGVSVIDTQEKYRHAYERLIGDNPDLTFSEYAAQMGEDFARQEGRIDYRSFTPRHFESAAFRNLQILFEGAYDGLIQPYQHYVPLKKDFSNLGEVLALLGNAQRRSEIVERAYKDLIASGRFTYERFIGSFDETLREGGVQEQRVDRRLDGRLRSYLADWSHFRRGAWAMEIALNENFASQPAIRNDINQAQQILREYAEVIGQRRVEDHAAWKRCYFRARDREFWRRLEQIAHFEIPKHPGLMNPPGIRSHVDRLTCRVLRMTHSSLRAGWYASQKA